MSLDLDLCSAFTTLLLLSIHDLNLRNFIGKSLKFFQHHLLYHSNTLLPSPNNSLPAILPGKSDLIGHIVELGVDLLQGLLQIGFHDLK